MSPQRPEPMPDPPERTFCSIAFTWADHRAMQDFRPVLRRHGGRQTIATDYAFSPEVVEIFASGRDEAAFILWREPDGITAMPLSDRAAQPLAAATMTECLERIGSSLATGG